MRRVQKAAAALAALALTTALAVPVWAENPGTSLIKDDKGTATCDVTATYTLEKKYHVDIEWGSMAFVYTSGTWMGNTGDTHQDNEEMTYNGNQSEIGWDNNVAQAGTSAKAPNPNHKITITNKSNADVGVTFEYTSDAPNAERVYGVFNDANADQNNKMILNDASNASGNAGVWLQRADINVTGTTLDSSPNATSRKDTAGLTAGGTESKAAVYLNLAGRPLNSIDNGKIGTITITVSDADSSVAGYDTYVTHYEVGKDKPKEATT